MAFERQGNVIAAHAAAIVGDLDKVQAALLEANIDLARPGINRIFDQLFQGAGRAFDDLTGSYPIYQAIWESSY
jgi:hypothetical protein